MPDPFVDSIDHYLRRVATLAAALPAASIGAFARLLQHVRDAGGTIFIFGNGGSAATASHLATDLAKITPPGAPRFRVMSLNDNAAQLTALANDLSYVHVFAEQLRGLGRPGDAAIVISGSGNSPNVLEALRVARAGGLITVGLLGFNGGQARGLVDLAIIVDSAEYGPIEDAHLIIAHAVATALRADETLAGRRSPAVALGNGAHAGPHVP